VLFDRGRRGLALQRFDVSRYRDRFNVFEVLITGSFTPGKKLLDGPVVSGPGVCVADRDRKERENGAIPRWNGKNWRPPLIYSAS
jgi:hypothetical protein